VQRSTANTKYFPVADHLPGRIQGFQTHAVRVKGRYIFGLPEKTNFQWSENVLNRDIRKMSFSRGSQAAK
jgi:hypothetical protein